MLEQAGMSLFHSFDRSVDYREELTNGITSFTLFSRCRRRTAFCPRGGTAAHRAVAAVTRLTRAGKLFFEHVPRVFAALQQARDAVQAAAQGFHGQLRVVLSDGITPARLPALLALCRKEEPEVEIRFSELPLAQQIKGLLDDLYDVGFALSDEVGDGIVASPVWRDALMIAVPARHPILTHKRIIRVLIFWKNLCHDKTIRTNPFIYNKEIAP